MSDLDILTKMPSSNYSEELKDVDSENFNNIIANRRSVRVFTDDIIPDDIVEKCLDNGLLAPTSSNLQSWKFYRIKTESKKAEVAKICMNQLAARTASELIVCVADYGNWKNIQKQMISAFDESEVPVSKGAYTYYQKIVPLAYNQGFLGLVGILKKIVFFFRGLSKVTPREPTSKADMRVWAHKTTALACQNIMMSFSAYGYDTCPMEGFDSKRLSKYLKLGSKEEVCMVIAAGKRAENGVFAPRLRMDKKQFLFNV